MLQELLLNSLHKQVGAILAPWREWIVPMRFHDSDEEYRVVRTSAGLIDWSIMGVIAVRGEDRIAFLHNLLTNDIKTLKPGSGCEAALVSPTAKLLAELIVLADEETHWLLMDGSRVATVLTTLEHHLITEAVTFHDRTAQDVVFALQGPKSLACLSEIFETQLAFRHVLEHRTVTVDSVPVRVVVHRLTGEPGIVVIVQAEHAAWLWDLFLQRGRPHGVIPVGWEALNVLRIEAGIPWYGIDMDDTNLLPETGLEERVVSYTKGCYVGQEVIARLQTYGSVSRKLMGLVCEGTLVPQPKDLIMKDGEESGIITSACLSPTLQRPIAMGYVKRPFYEVGTAVTVARADNVIAARLVKPPFISP
jgi:folate-binding protein YgfZ